MDIDLLKKLCAIQAPSGNEFPLKEFVVSYINSNKNKFEHAPTVHQGSHLQDNVIVSFGNPVAAFYAHMDSVGFTVRYQNQLLPIGSPEPVSGDWLCGQDALGPIDCQIEVTNDAMFHTFPRVIERGTNLVYKPKWKQNNHWITSPYLDNRIGIYTLLTLAKTANNMALVFSTYEEHGGGSVGYIAQFIASRFNVFKNIVVDVTWETEGVHLDQGPVVSLRDSFIPRKIFIDQICSFLNSKSLVYQKEVEGTGGSDGSEMQRSPLPLDWCFIGVAVQHPHTTTETASMLDIARLEVVLKSIADDFDWLP